MDMDRETTAAIDATRFTCAQCAGVMRFDPESESLRCDHCGQLDDIAPPTPEELAEATLERDFETAIAELQNEAPSLDVTLYKCDACAAEVTAPPQSMSITCPYCGSNIVAAPVQDRVIEPQALLPFRVTRDAAASSFRSWLHKRWFLPTSLKKAPLDQDKLRGVYTPYWTFDAHATTNYTGLRGDYYWVTQTYTTMVNGKPQVRTRQVRKTRWSPRAGVVEDQFDDVLIVAADSLPHSMVRQLEPWDLRALAKFDQQYLSGFQAERYHLELDEGFLACRERNRPVIQSTVMSAIGGDVQRITSMDTAYRDIAFRHVLLPIWISAYRHRGKVYRFLVNGRTGEIQAERPWSVWKILSLVAGVLLLGAAIAGIIALTR